MPGVRFIAIAAAVAVMVVVAGCASPGASGAGPTPHGSSSQSVSAAEANRAAAVAEARRILATYRPPAGATRLAHPPKGLLSSPALGTAVSPKFQVDDVAWFTVAHGDAQSLVAHTSRPVGSSSGVSANGGGPGVGVEYGIMYEWPPIDRVLAERSLTVSAQTLNRATIIRVDGIAAWQPPRDARSLVPATATAVTVTYRPGIFPSPPPTAQPPVTTTDPTQVGAIVRAVNAAQVWPDSDALPCPNDGGQLMTVVFTAGVDGPVATAAISPSGCAFVRLTVARGVDVTLQGGHQLAVAIGKIINQPWPTI